MQQDKWKNLDLNMMNGIFNSVPARYRFRLQDIRKNWFPHADHRKM
jgi:hypothetical protein